MKACATVGPSPMITLNAFEGAAVSLAQRLKIRASASADSGVSSAGFAVCEQPAASAGASLRAIIASGKFHGVIAKVAPTGSRMT